MNKKGFAHILIIAFVLLVIAVLVGLIMMASKPQVTQTPMAPEATSSDVVEPSPISDSTDVSTIEKEFNSTVTGSVDADINSMSQDASSL